MRTSKPLCIVGLGFAMSMAPPSMAENAYSHVEIFSNDLAMAVQRTGSIRQLALCKFNPSEAFFYELNCIDAVKNALKAEISSYAILFQLALKVFASPQGDMSGLSEEVEKVVQDISPDQPIDDMALQIIQGVDRIKQTYSP